VSLSLNESDLLVCGSAYCPAQIVSTEEVEEEDDLDSGNMTSMEPDHFNTSMNRIYVLAAIYLGCSIFAALIIAIFVDPISRYPRTHTNRPQ
jgi:hypothetical protein